MKISEGAVLDATLIEAAVNSRAKPQVIVEDRQDATDGVKNIFKFGKTSYVGLKRVTAQ